MTTTSINTSMIDDVPAEGRLVVNEHPVRVRCHMNGAIVTMLDDGHGDSGPGQKRQQILRLLAERDKDFDPLWSLVDPPRQWVATDGKVMSPIVGTMTSQLNERVIAKMNGRIEAHRRKGAERAAKRDERYKAAAAAKGAPIDAVVPPAVEAQQHNIQRALDAKADEAAAGAVRKGRNG